MRRIAISGSHGVGKTTLINAVKAELGDRVAVVGNVMRSLVAEGYPVGQDTTLATLAAYLNRQCDQELRPQGDVHVLSDRVLVDGLAYIMGAIESKVASYPWTESELTLLRAAARLHSSRFDCHVLLPVEFPLKVGDPLHRGGTEFQRAVEANLRAILSVDWPIEVREVRGTVEQRAAEIIGFLQSAK